MEAADDLKSSQHVLNDYNTTGNVNKFFKKKSKCILFTVSLATNFWEICRSKPCWATLATPTVNHVAEISLVSRFFCSDNRYIYS